MAGEAGGACCKFFRGDKNALAILAGDAAATLRVTLGGVLTACLGVDFRGDFWIFDRPEVDFKSFAVDSIGDFIGCDWPEVDSIGDTSIVLSMEPVAFSVGVSFPGGIEKDTDLGLFEVTPELVFFGVGRFAPWGDNMDFNGVLLDLMGVFTLL